MSILTVEEKVLAPREWKGLWGHSMSLPEPVNPVLHQQRSQVSWKSS